MPPKTVSKTSDGKKPAGKNTVAKDESSGEKTCLILQQKGTFRHSNITENSCENIGKIFRRAQNPELIGKWDNSDNQLLLYGYKKGKEGTENKHEIPPPFSDIVLFSDIALVNITLTGELKSFNHEGWSRFVSSIMGEDSDSDRSDEEYES